MAIRTLTVTRTRLLSPHLKRITLGGQELADFPVRAESGYVKVLFDPTGKLPVDERSSKGAIKRSFTVRAFRARDLELDIDFVIHGDSGPASAWAESAGKDDILSLTGPGPTKLADPSSDWFCFLGDLSALPAIAVNLELLPINSKGMVFLEAPSRDDCIDLEKPPEIKVEWVINSNPELPSIELFNKLKNMKWLDGAPFIWVAGEFGLMRSSRKFLKSHKAFVRGTYVSSYWKIDSTQEEMKKAKALEALKSKLHIN